MAPSDNTTPDQPKHRTIYEVCSGVPRRPRDGKAGSATLKSRMAQPLSPEHEKQTAAALEELAKATGNASTRDMTIDAAAFTIAMRDANIDKEFSGRLFQFLDEEKTGRVRVTCVVKALFALQHAGLEGRLRITFELFDTARSGRIHEQELYEILKVSFGGLGLKVTDAQLHEAARSMLADAIAVKRGVPIAIARESVCSSGGSTPIETASSEELPRVGSHGEKDPLKKAADGVSDMDSACEYGSEDAFDTKAVDLSFEEFMDMLRRNCHLVPTVMPKKCSPAKPKKCSALSKARDTVVRVYKRVRYKRYVPFYILVWTGFACAFAGGYLLNDKLPNGKVTGVSLPLAKAFAQVIQVVLALLLIPVCRQTVTALRNTPLRHIVPFDDSISLHRWFGKILLLCSLGHVGCHVNNYMKLANSTGYPKVFHGKHNPSAKYLWTDQTSITGYVALFALFVGFPFALTWPRQTKWIKSTWLGKKVLNNFTWFYNSHMFMFAVFYVAVVLHPWPGVPGYSHRHGHSITWIWIAPTLLVYLLERVVRSMWPSVRSADLVDVQLLPGKERVICLRVRKPISFHYSPGQYTFINVPSVAATEWHPFTITSAPGDKFVSVHIRVVGDWTGALWTKMQEYLESVRDTVAPKGTPADDELPKAASLARMLSYATRTSSAALSSGDLDDAERGASILARVKRRIWRPTRSSLQSHDWTPMPKAPRVLLDGPYAAPAQRWEDYEVVLMVGAGIGVTPFASVLADLVNRLNSKKCKLCKKLDPDLLSDGTGLMTEKIYFYWTVRDSQAPAYFKETLESISRDDQANLVSSNIHLTSLAAPDQSDDLRYIIARMGHEALFNQSGLDMITGLKSKVATVFGRPDWERVFTDIKQKHPGKRVGVFVCGPKNLANDLRNMCRKHNPTRRHRRIVHGKGAVEKEEGLHSLVVPQADIEAAMNNICEDPKAFITLPTIFDFYTEYF